MKLNTPTGLAFHSTMGALAVALLATGPGAFAAGSDNETPEAESAGQQDKVMVVPYKSRPAPSHRVSLHDGRVFFLTRLEETETGFVLHTTEEETIEVRRDEVAEVVEFKVE
jgi:hypothetical protein